MTPANKINAIVMTASIGGIAWLALNLWQNRTTSSLKPVGCPIKTLIGIPCPSCGITRALELLVTGHPGAAFMANPLSFTVGGTMFLAPIWIVMDFLRRKDSFYQTYLYVETMIKRKRIAFILIGIVIINWIWNIYKGV